MKKSMTTALLANGLLLASNAALATVINFDDTTGGLNFIGNNVSYAESGFTLTGTGGTDLNTVDPGFDNINIPSQNNTDFGYFNGECGPGTVCLTVTAASAFSLQSFNAANLDGNPAGNLTLTGYVSGGAILSEVFSTLGSNQWSLFSLTGWNNLTSVDIISQENALGLDNITVNAPAASTPEPSALWLFMSGLAGFGLFKKRKRVV